MAYEVMAYEGKAWRRHGLRDVMAYETSLESVEMVFVFLASEAQRWCRLSELACPAPAGLVSDHMMKDDKIGHVHADADTRFNTTSSQRLHKLLQRYFASLARSFDGICNNLHLICGRNNQVRNPALIAVVRESAPPRYVTVLPLVVSAVVDRPTGTNTSWGTKSSSLVPNRKSIRRHAASSPPPPPLSSLHHRPLITLPSLPPMSTRSRARLACRSTSAPAPMCRPKH